jgi:hypothetical protein
MVRREHASGVDDPSAGDPGRLQRSPCLARVGFVVALVLLSFYAAPLYFPPATATLAPPPLEAGLLTRLFPGVPEWWVAVRLVCLAVEGQRATPQPR